jgi:hypothetical protein
MLHIWKTALFLAPLFLLQVGLAQTLALPPRPAGALSRDEIIRIITPLPRDAREDSLFRYIMGGNVPDFMRKLVPVTSSAYIGGTLHSVTYHVAPDYFAVGSDAGYFLIPMTPLLAQRLADNLKCTLPTRKMVNDIYQAAALKIAPAPISPSAEMITVPVFVRHDSLVWTQRAAQLASYPPGTLVGGTKKDVVVSNKIRNELKAGVPKPVVIYGWHQLNGLAIQPIYNGHGETYADYSHGIRLVQEAVQLNGSPTTISSILKNDTLAGILSDEGPIQRPRYGDEPTGVEPGSGATLNGARILENFPNPFNPSTEIGFRLESNDFVTLVVYDILGRETSVLVNENRDRGRHEVTFNGSGLASGVYILRLTAGNFVQARRIVLVR